MKIMYKLTETTNVLVNTLVLTALSLISVGVVSIVCVIVKTIS